MLRSASETVDIEASADDVFAYVDDMGNVGWHMTGRSSMAMMGSKLTLELLSPHRTGLGAVYRYSGRTLGFILDFSQTVTTYVPALEKVWRTIGESRMLILDSYAMRLVVEPRSPASSRLTISIVYELPRAWGWWMVALVMAGWYSCWCLRQMCRDARRGAVASALVRERAAP